MKLTILGSSSALPTSERYPTAHVLNVHERLYLIDCGEGTQMQLRKNRIRFGKIDNIFISHLHGDHVFGLYGLLSTFNLMGREKPISLFAPESYRQMHKQHLSDFDINLGFDIEFTGLKGPDPVKILDDKYLTVTSIPLRHRVESYGFIFREKTGDRKIIKECIEKYKIPALRIAAIKKGDNYISENGECIKNEDITLDPPAPGSYAFCSDTSYFSRLASFVENVDVLYHEATFDKNLGELAKKTGHSTTVDAARTALNAKVKTLIIGHFSSRYKDIDTLVEEAREVFPETIPALEGKVYGEEYFKPD